MPKIDLLTAPVTQGSDYPGDLAAEFAERRRTRLGDAAGISAFGVNLTSLPPGGRSSLPHWHEAEEEMVYVLSGELTLIEDGPDAPTESTLGPGDAAGFPGGTGIAHVFVNRGTVPATYLEIGTRPAADRCHYADHDLVAHDQDGKTWYAQRDGTPVTDPKERF